MVIRQIRVGSMEDVHQYDDVDYDSAVETDQPMKAGTPIDPNDVLRLADILLLILTGASGVITVVTAIQAGGAGGVGFQYKDRTITVVNGLVTAIGAESGWNDV